MKFSGITMSMAAVGIVAGSIALWPASAQQPTDPAAPATTPSTTTPAPAARPGGFRGGEPPSEWREKLRDEARDHPRLGRALIALHEARDYLDKAPDDFGGHKASSIKACDDAIKEIGEALKFDPKHDPSKDRPARGGRGGGGGGAGGGGSGGGGGAAPTP